MLWCVSVGVSEKIMVPSYFDEWLTKPFIQCCYFIYSLDLILEMNVINQSQSWSKLSKQL